MEQKVTSLYIHFPFCHNCCGYCDFHKMRLESNGKLEQFEDQMKVQWKMTQELLKENNFGFESLSTLYIGGGTPSLWSPESFSKIFGKLDFAQKNEFTIEANPTEVTLEGIQAWMGIGVNRISMGIQSLDDTILKKLGRTHSAEDALFATKVLQTLSINFSVDFIIGVPGKRNITEELEKVLEFNPNHLSIYILTLDQENVLYKDLPEDVLIEREYLEVSTFLQAKGYLHYEVSNFGKVGFESQHNLAYWKSQSVAAVGPSATGLLAPALRYKWSVQENAYEIEKLTKSEIKLEALYMRLRTNLGVELKDYGITEKQACMLRQKWKASGYLNCRSEPIRLEAKGYLMLDSMMDDIFLL